MPDRRTNSDIRDRLEAIQRGYETWTSYTLHLLAILVVIQLGLGALSVYLVVQNSKRGDEIQASREQAVRTSCKEQNGRHDKTVAELDRLLAKLPSGPQKERALRSREGTVLLIEALAPRQDCEARVRKLTR